MRTARCRAAPLRQQRFQRVTLYNRDRGHGVIPTGDAEEGEGHSLEQHLVERLSPGYRRPRRW